MIKGFLITWFHLQLTVTPEDDFSRLETEGDAEYVVCTAWEHDTSFWKMTIIMDFDLVCDVSLYELAKMDPRSDVLILSPPCIRKEGAIGMVAFLMSDRSTHKVITFFTYHKIEH